MKKVICYVNQFFGGVGGEDTADCEPFIKEGTIGPTVAINAALQDAEVTHTIVCGDNFMGSNTEEAVSRIMEMLKDKQVDMFIAGPAFLAGRYGVACGNICKAVQEKMGIPVITSMNEENPGVEMFKKDIVIFRGGNGAAKMRQDVKVMMAYANKILAGASAANLLAIVDTLMDYVETNISLVEIMSLASVGLAADLSSAKQLRLPADGTFQSGMFGNVWCIKPNFEENKKLLREFIYG